MRHMVESFDGKDFDEDDFLEWIEDIERYFMYYRVLDHEQVEFVASKLHGEVSSWWKQLQSKRWRHGKRPIQSWRRMKKKIMSRFLPDYEKSIPVKHQQKPTQQQKQQQQCQQTLQTQQQNQQAVNWFQQQQRERMAEFRQHQEETQARMQQIMQQLRMKINCMMDKSDVSKQATSIQDGVVDKNCALKESGEGVMFESDVLVENVQDGSTIEFISEQVSEEQHDVEGINDQQDELMVSENQIVKDDIVMPSLFERELTVQVKKVIEEDLPIFSYIPKVEFVIPEKEKKDNFIFQVLKDVCPDGSQLSELQFHIMNSRTSSFQAGETDVGEYLRKYLGIFIRLVFDPGIFWQRCVS